MRIQRMGNFVCLTYLKRQKRLFDEGKISSLEYNFRVNKTLSEIEYTYFDFKEFNVWKCNKEKMQEDLEKIGIRSLLFSNKFYEEEEKI